MSNLPLVSICTPCYNHQKYLKDYFDGLLLQTYSNIELIICDDNSKDNSVAMIEKYIPQLSEKLCRVVFIKNPINLGVVKNCNNLLREAKGEYIKLIASDDIMLPECIKEEVGYLEMNQDVAMCYSNGYVIDDNFSYATGFQNLKRYYGYQQQYEKNTMFHRIMKGNFILAPSVLIRKNIYAKYGEYDENIGYEDHDYWLRISRFEKINYLNTALVCYRISNSSMTNYKTEGGKERFAAMIKSERKIIRKYIRYLSQQERTSVILNYFERVIKLGIDNNLKAIVLKFYKEALRKKVRLDLSTHCRVVMFFLNPWKV